MGAGTEAVVMGVHCDATVTTHEGTDSAAILLPSGLTKTQKGIALGTLSTYDMIPSVKYKAGKCGPLSPQSSTQVPLLTS